MLDVDLGQRVVLAPVLLGWGAEPLVDQPDVHPKPEASDMRERVSVLGCDVDVELLSELKGQRHRLVVVDLSSGQVPGVGVPLAVRGAMTQQRTPTSAQRACDTLNLLPWRPCPTAVATFLPGARAFGPRLSAGAGDAACRAGPFAACPLWAGVLLEGLPAGDRQHGTADVAGLLRGEEHEAGASSAG